MASWYAARSKKHDELLTELRNTNAAIMTAFMTANFALALKKQMVASLKNNFELEKARHLWWQRYGTRQFVLTADFETIPPQHWPIELLQDTLFGKVSLTGRPLAAVATLTQSYQSLRYAIQSRNDWIAHFKMAPHSGAEVAAMYFGLPDKLGNIDQTYPGMIEAASKYTDDCIYFCKLLCEDLREHAIALWRSYRAKYRRDTALPHRPDFSDVERTGLLPDPKEFEKWEKAFVKGPLQSPGPVISPDWYVNLKARVVRRS